MYEAKQNKERVNRRIDTDGKARQQIKIKNVRKAKDSIQLRLKNNLERPISRKLNVGNTLDKKVVQCYFLEYVYPNIISFKSGEPEKDMRPWIDPDTGKQKHEILNVYFKFDKTGLDRQKVKGNRAEGVILKNEDGGDRDWPEEMQDYSKQGGEDKSASARRKAIPNIPNPSYSNHHTWGHQLAKQWGGKPTMDNAAAVTNSTDPNGFAQEQYQTMAENAVSDVAKGQSIDISNFSLKHTAYLYKGTQVAKYMRFKIYFKQYDKWVKILDLVTPDFALYMKKTSKKFKNSMKEQLINSRSKCRQKDKEHEEKKEYLINTIGNNGRDEYNAESYSFLSSLENVYPIPAD